MTAAEIDWASAPGSAGAAPDLDDIWPADEPSSQGSRGAAMRDALLARMLTSEALDALPDSEPLIEGHLYRDTLVELFGKPGCGKSAVAIDWALCVASGKAWQGHDTTAARVLYVVGEGLLGFRKRRAAWSYSWSQPDTSGVQWLRGAVPLIDKGWVRALADVVAVGRPGLIVIDTLSRSIAGHDENAAATMSAVVDAADQIREAAAGACVLFVHHATKDGRSNRGHSALEGACDVRWSLVKDGQTLTLSNPKSKDEAELPDRTLRLTVVDLAPLGLVRTDGKPVTSVVVESHREHLSADALTDGQAKLLATMQDAFETTGASSTDLREVSELPKSTYHRALSALVKAGLFYSEGPKNRPRYYLTPTLVEVPDAGESH